MLSTNPIEVILLIGGQAVSAAISQRDVASLVGSAAKIEESEAKPGYHTVKLVGVNPSFLVPSWFLEASDQDANSKIDSDKERRVSFEREDDERHIEELSKWGV